MTPQPKTRFAKTIQIRNKIIGEGYPPYIVCEVACAHEGDFALAQHLIDSAVIAGSDAVQLQIFDPARNMTPTSRLYPLLQRLAFTRDQWRSLFAHARQYDIAISAFAYDYPSLELALELGADLIKLNSSDLLNVEMLQRIGAINVPVTIGTGASTMMEIATALETLLASGGDRVILMHGVQNFPTDMRHAHIRRLHILREAFNCLVGYADHTEADLPMSRMIDLVALGMGANLLEKHITHDRSKKGVDHQSALNPDEYIDYVHTIREASQALGDGRLRTFTQSDYQYRQFQKKTIVAVVDLPTNTTITRDKVDFLRVDKDYPDLSPADFSQIDGKRLIRPVPKWGLIRRADVERE